MGRKAKSGMKVTHTRSGLTGIISSVVGHTIRVVYRDGSESMGPASSYHKAGSGCAVIAILALAIPATMIGFGAAFLGRIVWG